MGIFDVFSNSKTSAQGDDSQNTTSGMSDVQYPIPAANSATGSQATQSQDEDEFTTFANSLNAQNDPLDITNQTASNNQPSQNVVETKPEVPVLDNPVNTNTNTYDYSTLVAPEKPLETTTNQPTLEANPETQEEPTRTEPEIKTPAPTIEFGVSQNTDSPTPANSSEPTVTNAFAGTEPSNTPTEVALEQQPVAEIKEFENPDGSFGDVSATNSNTQLLQPEVEQNQNNISSELEVKEFENPDGSFGDVVQEQDQTPIIQTNINQFEQTLSDIEPKQFENPDISFGAESEAEPQPQAQVMMAPQPEVQPSVQPSNINFEKEDTSMIGKINLKNIKKLGFLGLNTNQIDEGIKMDLTELSETIGNMIEEYIIDSSVGYAPELLRGLENKDLRIKSFQLRSAYSLFTQEPFNTNVYHNLTSYVFSDTLERLKNIIGSSDALVLVYSEGMNNLMSFFTVMNLSSFYKEMGKPFVLLGGKWETLLNTMVTENVLTQSDTKNILIATDSNELLAHLQTLDNNFNSKSSDVKNRVVDLRKEDDELIYLK